MSNRNPDDVRSFRVERAAEVARRIMEVHRKDSGLSISDLSRRFGVSRSVVREAVKQSTTGVGK